MEMKYVFVSGELHAGENYEKFLTEKFVAHAGRGSQSEFFPKFLIIFTGFVQCSQKSYFHFSFLKSVIK